MVVLVLVFMEYLKDMNKFTFHLLGLPHLPQSKKYLSCAFSQKNRKLARMLTDLGHTVYFYGSEGSDVEQYCNSKNLKFIQTHTLKDIRGSYGEGNNLFEIGYDWTSKDFKHDLSVSEKMPVTLKFNANVIEHINKVKKPDHFLLLTQGLYHKVIADAVKLFLTCETGIGYRGSYAEYRSFESTYIQNFTYGSENPFASMNGRYYDRVIPNYFDDEDIEVSYEKDDYALFVGRMIRRKGILTAYKACREAGIKLLIAGQGGVKTPSGSLVASENTEFEIPSGNWEYLGFVGVEQRKKLMARAKVVLTPTEYLEPFAGVHVEAMLSGTPVITTNFGVFPDTVINNFNGYRCDTLEDFVTALKKVDKLDYKAIRKHSEKYLMQNVALQFDKWFTDLYRVYLSTISDAKAWHFVGK